MQNKIIKINRAQKISNIGNNPRSFNAMIKIIPDTVIKNINSTDLALLVDSIWQGCQQAKLIFESEVCDQGYIWDSRQNKMRDLKD